MNRNIFKQNGFLFAKLVSYLTKSCTLAATTNTENNVQILSKQYICAAGGVTLLGQYSWLSTVNASGLSFLYLTN